MGAEPYTARGYGVWGEAPRRWAIFGYFLEKAILMPLDHISHVFIAFWKYWISNIWKSIEKI